jgi:hypothetical protein
MSCSRRRPGGWGIIPAWGGLGAQQAHANSSPTKNYILVYDVTVDLVRVLRVFRAAHSGLHEME